MRLLGGVTGSSGGAAGLSGGAARDPGLQPERTALAWRRTAVAAAGVALLCSITAVREGMPIVAVIAAVVAGAIVALSLLRPFHSRIRMSAGSASSAPWPAFVWLVACICAVSALGCALAVAGILRR
jgi:hypothetical protein